LDASYETLRVSDEGVGEAMRRLATAGGGNVTLPHKQRAAAELDWRSETVAACGACNCFWQDSRGRLAGDNTDVGGMEAVFGELEEVRLRGANVLLLGAGGAARAALVALGRVGVGRVDVWNRSRAGAQRLANEIGARVRVKEMRAIGRDEASRGSYALAVNATSLGLEEDDPLPLDLTHVRLSAAVDLVYAPGGTAWTRHATSLGIPARDGVEVLVRQAALSICCWTGLEAPLAEMRRAAQHALRREPS